MQGALMYKPLKDKIIVKPIPRIQSQLYIQTAEADTVGFVVAVSEESAKMGLSVGDKVHFGTLADDYKNEYLKWEPLEIDGERHLKMSWQDICFVVENEDWKHLHTSFGV